MAGRRIRGENLEIKIIKGGADVLLAERAIVSMEWEPQQEIVSQGFLGETTERKDEAYKGCRLSLTLQKSDRAVTQLIRDLNDRARRGVVAFKVNIGATEMYPDGQIAKLVFPDVQFGAMPANYAGRTEYGTVTLNGEVGDYKLLH